jgi:hypothetical protein
VVYIYIIFVVILMYFIKKGRIDAFQGKIQPCNWSKLSEILCARATASLAAAERISTRSRVYPERVLMHSDQSWPPVISSLGVHPCNLGMLREQNRDVAGIGRGTLFLYLLTTGTSSTASAAAKAIGTFSTGSTTPKQSSTASGTTTQGKGCLKQSPTGTSMASFTATSIAGAASASCQVTGLREWLLCASACA